LARLRATQHARRVLRTRRHENTLQRRVNEYTTSPTGQLANTTRSYITTSRATRWSPGGAGVKPARAYWARLTLKGATCSGALLAQTTRLKVGNTCVLGNFRSCTSDLYGLRTNSDGNRENARLYTLPDMTSQLSKALIGSPERSARKPARVDPRDFRSTGAGAPDCPPTEH